MQWSRVILALAIAPAAPVSSAGAKGRFSQSASSVTPQNSPVVTKFATPIYPQLARQTRVQGDVSISVGVRPDGSVESAVATSGHPLLRPAALDSSQHSQYECRGCTNPITPLSLSYTFQLKDVGCGQTVPASTSTVLRESKPTTLETQPKNHVLVVAEGVCIIDSWPDRTKVRSFKCLYLWKCALKH